MDINACFEYKAYVQMATATQKYTLKDFNDIIFNGFNIDISPDVISIISKLAQEVGSPDYVKTPVFKKKENPMKAEPVKDAGGYKKKRGPRDVDFDNMRSFQTTRLEEKVGLDAQIDVIRSYLNKMTDKNYIDIRNKVIDVIDSILLVGANGKDTDNDSVNESSKESSNEDIARVSVIIFEIASTNRFFSKMYAELYSDLIVKYDMMRHVFEESLSKFMDLFDLIEYVESTVDYDRFCKNNKDNEKRKALSAFFVNLMINNIIGKEKIIEITIKLLDQLNRFISQDNKKNEVDELTENIALLYNKTLYSASDALIDGMTIRQLIEKIANSKIKDYKSLTNKSVFKFMDLIDM